MGGGGGGWFGRGRGLSSASLLDRQLPISFPLSFPSDAQAFGVFPHILTPFVDFSFSAPRRTLRLLYTHRPLFDIHSLRLVISVYVPNTMN